MWEAWKSFNDVTQAFVYIAFHLFAAVSIDSQQFQLLEHFTVIVYDKISELQLVNELRQELFCRKEKTMKFQLNIPCYSTQNVQLIKLECGAYLSSMSSIHLLWDGHLKKIFGFQCGALMPIAAEVCSELIKCSCKWL